MSLVSKEQVLNGNEVGKLIEGVYQKNIIKYVSSGVIGLAVGKFIITYSKAIDIFFTKGIPMFLKESNFAFMGLLPFPNWFSVIVILGLIVGTWAEVKITQNKMLEAKRKR